MRVGARLAAGLLLVVVCSVVADQAAAHTRSQSRSTWWIDGPQASSVFTAAALEVTRLSDVAVADIAQVYAGHLSETVAVYAGTVRCNATQRPTPVPSEKGFVRVELAFLCDEGAVSAIEVASFMDVAPSHLHMADVRVDGGVAQDYFLSDAVRMRAIAAAGGKAEPGSFVDYVRMGIEHIMGGWDHLAFVAVLLLLCRRRREVVVTITGFTIGHSMTLGAAVGGWLVPNAAAVEALIGYTIAIAALEISVAGRVSARRAAATAAAVGLIAAVAAQASGNATVAMACGGLALFAVCYLLRCGIVPTSGATRLVLSSVFGLIHGLGFASVLIDMNLPTDRLFAALLGFNVGVELGQLFVVAALSALAIGVVRYARPSALVPAQTLVCSALGGVGVFWLVSRAFG
jgi:hypothetical protein